MSHFLKMKKLSLIAMTALSTLAATASAATSIDPANPFNAPLTAAKDAQQMADAKDAAQPGGAKQMTDVKTLGLIKKAPMANAKKAAVVGSSPNVIDDGKACINAANAQDAKQQAPQGSIKLAGAPGGGSGGISSDATIAADAKNTLIPDGAGMKLAEAAKVTGSAQKLGAAVLGAASALMA
jgi:hypothetical protein